MARPKTDITIKRTKHIMTRFTETEYALLQDYAKSSNKPVSTYVHDAALSNKVDPRIAICLILSYVLSNKTDLRL